MIISQDSVNYKLSRFTRVIHKEDRMYVFNSLTGLKAKIVDSILINQLSELEKGSILSEIDGRLLSTKICVPCNIDEEVIASTRAYNYLTSNYSSLRLIILPTRECNFRCVYCYEDKRKEYMSDETENALVDATIDYLQNYKICKSLLLEWFGGEPLLCKATIVRIAKRLKAYCDENDVFFSMSMTTNGYLLDIETARVLSELNLISYQITIDGNESNHNQLRALKNGGKTWATIYHNLLAIKESEIKNVKIRIRINYHAELLDTITPFLEQLKADFNDTRFGIFMIKINPPVDKDLPYTFISDKAEILTQDYIFDLFSNEQIGIDEYLANINPFAPICYARQNSVLVIDVDGTIRKCTEYLEDNSYNNIGTISGGKFNINNDLHMQWLMPPNDLLEARKCRDCSDMPICLGGVCPAQWFREKRISCNMFHLLVGKMLDIYFSERDPANEKNNY